MSLFIISGISGSGKSVAIRALEDAGYDCVDNLPITLLESFVENLHTSGSEKLAVAIDARRGSSIQDLPLIIAQLKKKYDVKVLFLNASTEALVKRFSETRRRHPLSSKSAEQSEKSLVEAINTERTLLESLSEISHRIDTSNITSNTLRKWITDLFEHENHGLTLLFESFGFKHGAPQDADMVFDVRCIANPFYEDELRKLTGYDQPVIDFLNKQPDFHLLFKDILAFITTWLPRYKLDGRSYLTVAIGCTGGQHRSVAMVNRIFQECQSSRYPALKGVQLLCRHREQAGLGHHITATTNQSRSEAV